MIKPLVQKLRYSIAYKVILGILNLLLLAIIIFLCNRLYISTPTFDVPFTILIVALGLSIFLYYRLIQYSHYVLQWYASLSDQGLRIFDPRKGQLDYYWDTDIVIIESFNLCMVKGHYGSPERMSRTYSGFKISKWLNGHKQIVDSQVAFLVKRQLKHILLEEIDHTRLIEQSRQAYYQFLTNNKWNMLYLAYYFFRVTTALLVLYVVIFDMFYFNPPIALAICIIVAIQLAISVQYWDLLTVQNSLKQMATCIIAIVAFSFIMFDNVHFKDERFFFTGGIVFGAVLTLSIFVFVYFYRPRVLTLHREITLGIFLTYFVLLSLFSGAFLKVGNIVFSEQPSVWEKATAEAPLLLFIMPGSDPDFVKFDNKEWGSHYMGLFFLNWAEIKKSSQRVELLTYQGRLGIPWMYKNYQRDETAKAKIITDTE